MTNFDIKCFANDQIFQIKCQSKYLHCCLVAGPNLEVSVFRNVIADLLLLNSSFGFKQNSFRSAGWILRIFWLVHYRFSIEALGAIFDGLLIMRLPLHLSLHGDAFILGSIICNHWCQLSSRQNHLELKSEMVTNESHLQLLSLYFYVKIYAEQMQ